MGFANIGDQAVRGLGDAAQEVDLPLVVSAHFDDGHLQPGRHGQQGQRHSNMVVQVALGGVQAVMAAQHGCQQFFRGRFTVTAGNGDHRYEELPAVMARQLLKGLQAVVHQDIAAALHRRRIVDNGISGAGIQGGGGELVSVEPLALNGKKQAAAFHFAGVYHHF